MKLVVAVENTVAFPFTPGVRPGILGEHGLALVVEHRGGLWLYDTGRGRTLLPNLATLGISPDAFDGVILSHGHLDHFGALKAFLEARTKRVPVYMHPGAFVKRYTRVGEGCRPVGMPWSPEELTSAGGDLCLSDEPQELAPGLWLTGFVPRANDFEFIAEQFFTEDENGEKHRDQLLDDQALVADTKGGAVVLTGCAHAGVCNIIDVAAKLRPALPIRGVAGGLHLTGAPQERVRRTVEYLKALAPTALAVGHCTGFSACCTLAQAVPEAFLPLSAGSTITLD